MELAKPVHVVVVGSTNFDVVVKADRMPREGETLLASHLQFFPGGKGANQAVAVARLGAKTTMLGAVGEDMIGEFLLEGLAANGVDATRVKRDSARRTWHCFHYVVPQRRQLHCG